MPHRPLRRQHPPLQPEWPLDLLVPEVPEVSFSSETGVPG
jgi:hypothetical protein